MSKMGRVGFINSFVEGTERRSDRRRAQQAQQAQADREQMMFDFKIRQALQQAQQDAQAVEMKRAEFDLQKKKFDLEEKKVMADIEYKKHFRQISNEMYEMQLNDIKEAKKLIKAETDQQQMQLDAASDEAYGRVRTFGQVLQNNQKIRMHMGPEGPSMTITQEPYKPPAQEKVGLKKMEREDNKAMGALKAGGFFEDGVFVEFEGRKDAERYANNTLGADYEKKHPQTKEMLNSMYGPRPEDFPIDKFKATDNPLRAAYEYLIDEIGMDPEAARQYLEENN